MAVSMFNNLPPNAQIVQYKVFKKIHRVPLATEPDMNCNNFNNFNTNGDIAVKFEVNLFYATMGLFAMLFVIIALRL